MKKRAAAIISALFVGAFLASACSGGGGGGNPFDVRSELVTPASNPIAMAFAPDGRLFYNEQYTGNVRVIAADGTLQEEPFATVEVFAKFDWGLIGIALDPAFEQNGYVYVSYMDPVPTRGEDVARPTVMRFTDSGGRGEDPEVIVGDLPESDPDHPFFSGIGNIGFGPDGYLYISMGDHEIAEAPQDLAAPQGKILRVDSWAGSPALDNPFVDQRGADPRVFAYGFDEVFDFDFHPQTGQLYAADSGSVTCEELNLIQPGGNYSWPLNHEFRYSDCLEGQVATPIHFFAPEGKSPLEGSVRPVGLAFLSQSPYPGLSDNSLLVCELNSQFMRRLTLGGDNQDQVVDDDVVVEDCGLDIAISPDGIIYYSNLKEIRRLIPESE